jgi:nitroreductase
MKNLIDCILTRRSIRKYTEQEISGARIEQLLEAAMHAPSAQNQQPWHFIVIRERKMIDTIADRHSYAKMLYNANKVILICGDTDKEISKGYWPVDCSAATQNLLLAAHALGLGAVWLGVHPMEDRKTMLRELFSLPDNIQPFALVSLGYPAEERSATGRFKKERIHYDKW